MLMKAVMNYQDLRALGYPQNQARRIIRQAKRNLVKQGFAFYNGKRVGLVPTTAWRKLSNEVNEN